MSKIKGLYRSFCLERDADCREYLTGGDTMEDLKNFLKQKLSADDYFTVEEMLNALAVEIEEKGFEAGAKYTAGLGVELMTK